VTLKYPPSQDEKDSTLELFAGENLRLGMLVRGVKLNDPLARRFDTKSEGNCGAGGLCRTCSVSVLRGADLLNPQKPAEKQMLQDNPRWRLGCKAFVGYGMKEGEMVVQVNPNQW
jgi:Na+-transporting NADH:ubiquinone oxidoreductase subunit NqrF